MAKRILCFGDSNTWGYISGVPTISRYDEHTRWTGRLQASLGNDYTVLEFGLCGCESGAKLRNKCYNANAQELYPSILFASVPVQTVVIMLGTNDLKKQNNWHAGDTAANLKVLLSVTRAFAPSAQIVLATPVLLQPSIVSDPEFDLTAVEKSAQCAQEVAELARAERLTLFDTNAYVHELGADGCHFTEGAHQAFAEHIRPLLA